MTQQHQITAARTVSESEPPQCEEREFSISLGVSVRAYGHATINATSAKKAAEIVRAQASKQDGPWDSVHEVDWSTACEPSILYVIDNTTNTDEIGNIDLSPADDSNAVITAEDLLAEIEGEHKTEPRSIIDTENPAHALDISANMSVIWSALEAVREDLLSEGDESNDAQWNEITSAMAVISEELGIDQTEHEG